MDRELDRSERRQQVLRSILPLVATVIVIAAVGGFALRTLRPSVRMRDIRVARVDRGEVEATIDAAGTVIPAFEKAMSSPVEARVVEILRRPGALVKTGDEIVVLDTRGSRVELEKLDQQIAQKASEQTRLEIRIDEDRTDLESRVEQKTLDLEILRHRVTMSRTLRDEGLIAEETLRQADVEARKAEIELAQLLASVERSRRRDDAELDGIALDLSILRKQREEAARQLELAAMRADRDGVVTWVTPEAGATVRRGDVIARVADLSSFRIQSTASDIHAGRLRPGLYAVVPIGEMSLRGTVSSIDPTIANGVVTFVVDLDDASSPGLRNNLRVDVRVVTAQRPSVLRLKRGPHITDARRQEVFVVRGEQAVRTTVELGLIGHDFVEVVSGLEPGDVVMISDMQDYVQIRQIRIR